MANENSDHKSWIGQNSGALIIGALVFASQFIFTTMVGKDEKAEKGLQTMAIELTAIKVKLDPLIAAFNAASTDRYTEKDAMRDQARIEVQFREVKQSQEQQRKNIEILMRRINQIESENPP